MKKYFVIAVVLLFSTSLVVYYAFRWAEIDKTIGEFSHIEYKSYKLEILIQNHKLLLNSLRSEYNYDEIAKSTLNLDSTVNEFTDVLVNSKDTHLIKFAQLIKYKSKELSYIYEDIKTDSAEIKNSLKWLSTNYKKYLLNTKAYSLEDVKLMKYIFNLLSITAQSNMFVKIEPYQGKSNNLEIYRLATHLDVVYDEYNKLILLQKKLKKNDIIPHLKEVDEYLEKVKDELHSEATYIVKALLISSIFLVIFGVIIYIREAIARTEANRLKSEVQQFVDALNESAIVSKTDLRGRITYVNDKFCEASGYKRDELMGKAHNIVRHPDMPSEVFKKLWDTIKDKKVFKATIKNRTKNGEAYYVDSTVLPLVDINGKTYEYLAVRYEVTELIQSRDKAIVAEKAKDEFLSNMSHELRTPLNSIHGFSGILQRKIKDEKSSSYIKNIIDSSDHLIDIINDILDLSKLQSGKFVLDFHDFNTDEKIHLFLKRFDAQLELAELKMNVNLSESLKITLHGDWLRISQIISNLLSNAIKFTPKGKAVDFSAKYEDGNLTIVVADEGIGMNKEAKEKIFQPFEQADGSTTRKYGGTGLGLSIVGSLIKQMGGAIKLSSQEGIGSRFEVIIPLEEVSDSYIEGAKIHDDESIAELKGHILIAEDNKTNQILVGVLIEEFGLTYKIVDDGEKAVEEFGKNEYDLVLMDENMPNLSGTAATRIIHKRYGKDVPIIALTANVMRGDKEKFLAAGMNGFIAKPIDNEELYKVLKSFLNKKI